MKYNRLMCFNKSLYILCVVLTFFACQQENTQLETVTPVVEQPVAVYPDYDMDWNQVELKTYSQGILNLDLSYVRKFPDESTSSSLAFADQHFGLLTDKNMVVNYSKDRNINVYNLSTGNDHDPFVFPTSSDTDAYILNNGYLSNGFLYYVAQLRTEDNLYPLVDHLYCGDTESGKLIWSKDLEWLHSTEMLAGRSSIYLASFDGKVAAFDKADGFVLWETSFEDSFRKKPILTKGTLLLLGISGTAYRLNLTDGSLIEKITLSVEVDQCNDPGLPILHKDILYFIDHNNTLHAVNMLSGAVYFSFETGTKGYGSIIKYKGDILFHNDSGYLALVDHETGKPRWIQNLENNSAPLYFIYGNTLYVTAGNELILMHAGSGKIIEKKIMDVADISAVAPGPDGLLLLSSKGTLIHAVGEDGMLSDQSADLSRVEEFYTVSENEEYSIGLGDDSANVFFTPDDDAVYSVILNTIDVNFNMFSDDNMMVTTNFNGTENVQVLKVRLTGGRKYRFEIEKLNTSASDFIFSMRVRKNEV